MSSMRRLSTLAGTLRSLVSVIIEWRRVLECLSRRNVEDYHALGVHEAGCCLRAIGLPLLGHVDQVTRHQISEWSTVQHGHDAQPWHLAPLGVFPPLDIEQGKTLL